jgi:Rieske Fe-S protein
MEKDRLSRAGFVRLGAGLTLAGASATLAACGGGGNSGDGGGGSTAPPAANNGGGNTSGGNTGDARGTTQGDAQGGGEAIAAESQVKPGSAVKFQDGGQPAVLVHLQNGDFVAYSAVCTHQQCTVAYRDGDLACPCHGSIFNPADGGAVVQGPATRPLPEIPVEIRDGQVYKA